MQPELALKFGPLPSQVGPDHIAALCARAAVAPPGPFVEVGVFQGGTAWHLAKIAQEQGRDIWLYDTFAGIPYSGPNDSHKIGDFAACSYDDVRAAIPYARVVQGIYPQSAWGLLYGPVKPIAFVHLDCDQERAYREALAFLIPRMAKGGVMWFDDAPCLPGAMKAVADVFAAERIRETAGKWWVEL
jgi:O-methyltransferase